MGVTATLPGLPASGVASVTLTPATGSAIVLAGTTSTTYGFTLQTTAAAPGIEGPFSFTVAVKTVVQQSANASGSRNVDDVAPTMGPITVLKPTPGSGPLAFGHDGIFFNLTDGSLPVLTFIGYDCGSGLNGPNNGSSIVPGPGSAPISSVASGATFTCPNQNIAKVYTYTLALDPATIARSSLPNENNSVPISIGLADPLGHGVGAGPSIPVTRRLWQSASIGATKIALGPQLFTLGSGGLIAVNKATGANTTWDAQATVAGADVAVGGTSANPLVYWLSSSSVSAGQMVVSPANLNSPSSFGCSIGAKASNSTTGRCLVNAIGDPIGGFINTTTKGAAIEGIVVRDSGAAIGTALNITTGSSYDCVAGVTTTSSSSSVVTTINTGSACPALAVEVNAPALHGASLFGLTNDTGGPQAFPLAGGSSSVSNGTGAIQLTASVTASGESVYLDSGQRWDYSNGVWGTSAAATGFVGLPLIGLGTDFGALAVARGTTTYVVTNLLAGTRGVYPATGGARALAIDGAGTAFLSGVNVAADVVGVSINSTNGFGSVTWPGRAFPAAIDDLVIDQSGVIYVASGGQVFALQTDSPGLGTDTTKASANNQSSWPARGRDACRSRNLSFSCPW